MQKPLLPKSFTLLLAIFLLGGCDYSLRIPFPSIFREDDGTHPLGQTIPTIDSISPLNPAFGETVTVQISGLQAGYAYSIYLSTRDESGGDPEEAYSPRVTPPYFRVGKLPIGNSSATLSFDIRPVLGTDQYGDAFILASGQRVNVSLTGRKNGSQALLTAGSTESLIIK